MSDEQKAILTKAELTDKILEIESATSELLTEMRAMRESVVEIEERIRKLEGHINIARGGITRKECDLQLSKLDG